MKYFKIYSAMLFLALTGLMSSCFDDAGTDILLTDTYVEIGEATTSSGLDVAKAYDRFNDGLSVRDSIRINLVGAHRSTPVSVSFDIDESSTAVEGVHYTMISSGSVTIPANSSFGYIYFEVMPDNIEAGEVWKLKFTLTSTEADVKVSENYKTFTRSIRINCPFVRDNFLGDFSCLEPGYGTYTVTFTADPDDEFSIISDNFWDFGGVVKYTYDPTLKRFTLPTQAVTMGGQPYSLTQGGGTPTIDFCGLAFTMPYSLSGSGTDNNVHTFTKQ